MVGTSEKRREWQDVKLNEHSKTFLSSLTAVFLERVVLFSLYILTTNYYLCLNLPYFFISLTISVSF